MRTLSKEHIFLDKFPPAAHINIPAQILRRGLAVSAFSLLERFIEKRFGELFIQLSKTSISFHNFSDRMQEFLTIEALQGLNNRVKFLEKPDKQPYVVSKIKTIAGHDNNPPTYTALGFSPKGSNVSGDDLAGALRAIGIEKPWKLMNGVTNDIGISRLSLKDDFSAVAKRRHKSAHDSSFILPYQDLEDLLDGIIALGISFDVIITAAIESYMKAQNYGNLERKLSGLNFSYRFIDEQSDGSWKERSFPMMKTIKRYKTEDEAVSYVENRKVKKFNIIRDQSGIPIELF